MTAHIRMQSFVWSPWFTSAILAFGILFIMGMDFLSFALAALFVPKYLIYWGPNPPDPLGRFAPKNGLSPNLVAFGRIFLTKKRICL